MGMRIVTAAALAAFLANGSAALAHHSFAVFFDSDKLITIKGAVTSFAFRNPHGLIELDVPTAKGVEHWGVETNAPVVLQRRGWSRNSLTPGETVTIQGWASRDGKHYVRLMKATRADGHVIGVPFDQSDK